MSKRVLIVDDEAAIRAVLRMMLEGEGYEVHTDSRTGPAFEKFKLVKPFLVLCDLRLENHVDGATLAGMIRRNDPFAILICVTGELSSFDKGYLLGSGIFTDILLKPVEIALLRRVAKYALNKYERWKSY
jgi:CheY-like chemotaxis protein